MGLFDVVADAVISIKKNDNHSNSFMSGDIKNSLIIGMEWNGKKDFVDITNWNTEQLKGVQIPLGKDEQIKISLIVKQTVTGVSKDTFDFFDDSFKDGYTSNSYSVKAVIAEETIFGNNIKKAKKVVSEYMDKLLNVEKEFKQMISKIDNPKVIIPLKYENQVELEHRIGLKNFPSSRMIPLWNVKNIQKTDKGIEIEFKNGMSAKEMGNIIKEWLKNPVRDMIAEKGVPKYEVLQVSHYFCTDTVKLSHLMEGKDVFIPEQPKQIVSFPVEINRLRSSNDSYRDRFKLDIPAYSISVRHQKEWLTEFVVPKEKFPLKVIDTKRDMYLELKDTNAIKNFLDFPVNYLKEFKPMQDKPKVKVADLSITQENKVNSKSRAI